MNGKLSRIIKQLLLSVYRPFSSPFVKVYPVSTSKYGIGTEENSLKTPLGLHYIRDKNGAGTPLGGILVHGRYTVSQAYI